MGHLIYKVFNLYFSIRCRTYNSHLHATPPQVWVHLFIMLPLKRKLLLACIVVDGFSANRPTLLVPPLLLSAQTDWLPRSYPLSNGAPVPLLGHEGSSGGPSTSRLEQPHKQERRDTLTQNLKTMSLWVLLLIRCSTFTLLSDVGHITHSCT